MFAGMARANPIEAYFEKSENYDCKKFYGTGPGPFLAFEIA
jgi:hypothetical protein